ncbi:MAG: 50S ribosomal protein L9 [Mollicutes bacterium PWAP]|nr:50S ribosomal protein L9 [Mollicutes bacterium PWAP]
MKVVIIKKYQNYNINDIVEFADGFAKNFLIKKGYAISLNASTKKMIERRNEQILKTNNINKKNSLKLKEALENKPFIFELKVKNNVVFNSITKKDLNKKLSKMNFKLPNHSLENFKINSIGLTIVNVKLPMGVIANIKIKAIPNE